MAERRMFAKSIIDSDAFIDMSTTARLLYFDLGMRADDDGFVDSQNKIMRMTGATKEDLKELIDNSFIIQFESGIIVITHWRIHNYLRSDRYKPTLHRVEREQLLQKPNKAYEIRSADGVSDGIPLVDADKKRIEEERKEKDKRSARPTQSKYVNFEPTIETDWDDLAQQVMVKQNEESGGSE